MGSPVVHFEVIGKNPDALRAYFAELFDWRFDTPSPVAPEISNGEAYGFVTPLPMGTPDTIPGGIGGGANFTPHTVFYVGVPNVEAALRKAESLGGTRVMGPTANPNGQLVVGHFRDPEGNLVGVAGPA